MSIAAGYLWLHMSFGGSPDVAAVIQVTANIRENHAKRAINGWKLGWPFLGKDFLSYLLLEQ